MILEWMDYPGRDDLKVDLTIGFEMLGKLHRGTGWKDRNDNRYKLPNPIDKLKSENLEYLKDRLRRKDKCLHAELLLQEILDEVDQARIEGPFRAPKAWGIEFAAV